MAYFLRFSLFFGSVLFAKNINFFIILLYPLHAQFFNTFKMGCHFEFTITIQTIRYIKLILIKQQDFKSYIGLGNLIWKKSRDFRKIK